MSALGRRERFGFVMAEAQSRMVQLSQRTVEIRNSTDPHVRHRIMLLTSQGLSEDEAAIKIARSTLKFS